jgi:hypothetical protein
MSFLVGFTLEGHAVFKVLEAPCAGLRRAEAVYLADLGAESCEGLALGEGKEKEVDLP